MSATMTLHDSSTLSSKVSRDNESDYGTDIDEQDLSDLLLRADSQPLHDIVLTSIEQDPVTEHATIHLRSSGQEAQHSIIDNSIGHPPLTVATKVEYSRRSFSSARRDPAHEESKAEPDASSREDQSPLERFRTHPKKPLSVTDIVSPAWCEQQYLYSLSKHGRVRRTPAMRQGSKVHKRLEEQVHTTVRIEVKSREDMFGLKLWNIVQSLRTLRATGITREMEVWGLLDGQVVNGIIDEVTIECPDEGHEARLLQHDQGTDKRKKRQVQLESNQTTLTHLLTPSQGDQPEVHEVSTYYLVDVKTRQSRTLPANDGRLRPTQMQLMLYHRLLSSMASDAVDKNAVFERYKLDGAAVFSDTFIAEVSKLDSDAHSRNHPPNHPPQDSISELLANNTLSALWSYMIAEFSKTMPGPTSCISPLLTAEFRTAADGEFLGKRSFEFDAGKLDGYVRDELNWWKGERPTKGVEIEEAYKCRICEFAEDCSWRKGKMEAAVLETRQRRSTSQRTGNG